MAVVVFSALVLISLVGTLLLRLWRMRIREAGILNNLARSESEVPGTWHRWSLVGSATSMATGVVLTSMGATWR